MASRPDGPRTGVRKRDSRIDWGARRREVNRILAAPREEIWWGCEPAEIFEALHEALYLAESAAERVPNPGLLLALIRAKGAANELWARAGKPGLAM
jgi:hypothetical protein